MENSNKIASRQSRSNESNTNSKRQVAQAKMNIKSLNAQLGAEGSNEREPVVDLTNPMGGTLDNRGHSGKTKPSNLGSSDKKLRGENVVSQDSKSGSQEQFNNLAKNENFHLSNKSDLNLINQNSSQSNKGNSHQISQMTTGPNNGTTGKKKRKNSDKAQRRTSNNRKEKQEQASNGGMFPPADNNGNGSNPRSQSRGTVSQQSHGNMGTKETQQSQNMQQQMQYYENQNFNPFAGQNGAFGIMGNQSGFPFGQNPANFMGGGQQAPQVHFIAKKQQFIAQISPEQLMNSDKRPYTTQSLHNLSANAKRAGSVYANALGNSSKNGNGAYNIANAAFANHPNVYLSGGNRTHTQGFNFHPNGPQQSNFHKYTHSMYGEDVKPKVAGKDILQSLGPNYNSGYNSDPYNSVMSQGGLPASLTHSNRPVKAKASQNRLQAKEKEQLYEETIKMKMLNNQIKEDNVKLKTKVKILENELSRKEKTIEDLFSHNQLITQSQKHQTNSNQNLLPLAQTAQKYQQETFLVMSLKKQIRELKYEVVKRDDELEVLRKNIKNTKTKEYEQEIQTYSEECQRLRSITEELIKQGAEHPIHQENFNIRLSQMQQELQHKDMMIQQLSESLQSHIQMEKSVPLAAIKAENSQHIDSTPSDINANMSREKSVEKKNPNAQKDTVKELQKAKKALREKEKELQKLKADFGQIKRENQEKMKNESQQNKDVETQMKTLKDKLKETKQDNKRKEERLGESEARVKRLEEQMKSYVEQIKASEESNKSLKQQLKQKAVSKEKEKKTTADTTKENTIAVNAPEEKETVAAAPPKPAQDRDRPKPPKAEIALLTLIAQREKLCRDDLTAMMLAGEESLKMLIRRPSEQLIDFIKANLSDEDTILAAIPRFEMPKTDFETQVLREMRIVLRENADNIAKQCKTECINWKEFEEIYSKLDNFEYPHKDKLLEFIKYFFLDHIVSEDVVMMNFHAFCDHLISPVSKKGMLSAEKTRNDNSSLKSRRRSGESGESFGASDENIKRRLMGAGSDDGKLDEEERMLDIAEQCFMRIADLLHMQQKTVKQIFLKYSQPEKFKDGSVLELLSPRSFLEGVRDTGFDDVTEMEAACLMKVLAKPELENAVILNEFVLIMENFGIPPVTEEEEFENDYEPDSDQEESKGTEQSQIEEEKKIENKELQDLNDKLKKFGESKKIKNPLVIKFNILDEKATKILKKLARFLLERYMHPREFFGPTIKKEVIGAKKCKVEIIKLQDFYLRLKLASIRKKLKQNDSLNLFLAIDGDKYPGFVQVKKMIKALEAIAEGEQELMLKEQEEKELQEREEAMKELLERKERGEPDLSLEELIAKKRKEKQEELEKQKKKELKIGEAAAESKPPKGPPGSIEKLGSKSPKSGESKNRFASHLGPNLQLNTIEEDLHETQTSHYSYQVKEGDGSERDGSKHQLSTSNHLRSSNNMQQDVGDSSRRSKNGGLPMGISVQSGDYSGGSQSGSKKKMKDIEERDVKINDFKQVERTRSEMGNNKSERLHMPNQLLDSQNAVMVDTSDLPVSKTQQVKNDGKGHNIAAEPPEEDYSDDDMEISPQKQIESIINNLDLEDAEIEQKLKDELDEEVDKKFATQMQSSNKGNQNASDQDLQEDTIKTDKIEQIIDDEQDYELPATSKQQEEIEEYSYHDEASQQPTPKAQQDPKNAKQDSDYEEDYEF